MAAKAMFCLRSLDTFQTLAFERTLQPRLFLNCSLGLLATLDP